jgi:predicted aspartyl protease
MFTSLCFSLAVLLIYATATLAAEFDSSITMTDKGASTYYVPCTIEGYGDVDLMFDTGSSYMTINEQMLEVLRERGHATFVKKLDARMADGSRSIIPVYRLSSIQLGKHCALHDVEAAVMPGATRNLLGLNALKMAGPFIFYANPPRLVLSHCAAKVKERI